MDHGAGRSRPISQVISEINRLVGRLRIQRGLEFVRILGLDYEGLTDPEPDLLVEPDFVDFISLAVMQKTVQKS